MSVRSFSNTLRSMSLAAAMDTGANVVISLCRMGTRDLPEDHEHVVIGLIDTVAEDNPNLSFVLADTVDFVASQAEKGRKVYVHCFKAQNRTPAVAATYLVRRQGMSVDAALDAVHRGPRSQPQPFLSEAIGRAAAYGPQGSGSSSTLEAPHSGLSKVIV